VIAERAASTPATFPDDADWYVRMWAFFARTGLRCFTRVHIEGLAGAVAKLPPGGPLIIASNHASNADGVLIGGWLTPALGRRIHWLGKREMIDAPIMGPLARRGSVHPVDRAGADVEAFRLAVRILEEGHVLMVFPEGTRSHDGRLHEAKDGLAMLAMRTGARILPIGVSGTHRFWPRGSMWRIGGQITLRAGDPFTLDEALDQGVLKDRKTAKAAATGAIMRRIAALLPPDQRGAYAPIHRHVRSRRPASSG
jgi:1-acyl-sn-glycerol-3-phosphate acyltransferase